MIQGAQIAGRHLLAATLDVLRTKLIPTVRLAVLTEAMRTFLGLVDSGWGAMPSDALNDPLLFSWAALATPELPPCEQTRIGA